MVDEILNVVQRAGYGVWRGSRRVGSHDVCVSRSGRGVYSVGVNASLSEQTRDELWRHHGRIIALAIKEAGFKIDLNELERVSFRTIRI